MGLIKCKANIAFRSSSRQISAVLALLILFTALNCLSADNNFVPKITLEFKDTDIRDVLQAVSVAAGVNIAANAGVEGKVSVRLKDMTLEQAIKTVVDTCKCYYRFEDNLYRISKTPFPELPTVDVDALGLVSVQARDADLRQLLLDISREAHVSLVPAEDISKKISVELHSIPTSEIVPVLAKAGGIQCSQVNGVWYASAYPTVVAPQPSKQETPANKVTEKTVVSDEDKRIVTQIVYPKYLKASQMVDYLSKACLSEAASIAGTPPEIKKTADDNALLITTTKGALERIIRDLEVIDIPTPQVMLEARILDVSTSKDKNIGLTLAKWSENNIALDVLQGQVAYVMKGVSKDLNVTFQALITNGAAKVVANPSICTLSGHEASIDIGQVRYYKITNYSDDNQPSSQYPAYYPYSTLQTINSGISLKITPWVGSTGEITATIQPEVSTVTGVTTEGLPEIDRRKANTIIRIHDGDTIVIGGLKQQERTKSVTKVPILGSLPIIGQLFNNTKSAMRDSELLILITPRILSIDRDTPAEVSDKPQDDSKTEQAIPNSDTGKAKADADKGTDDVR